ncbi:MAG: beta-ketoacyl-[acyl-carrier-protein] synthase family protein [Bacteroides acidifaciens]|uniref:beta-ketoacyl-[acyl-carrier-protein] synthase family protein n=1 Tax=Bacteroides acidifaciens TaxID=85831 RepID=UPI0023C827C3|nr:beta-ketoacyl-[acyl-carrier-protein] synthase family protein [Bacteroides acidifaciens]MDE6821996.1 beta-ketoacyl-[acyl-carrier-protein] synthase family protein [Bacteroides acidifaciens]MDE6988844.1 beta-ketoacyl-[acyl-carrier-protein] synthase family protein [Bacteroides acidifaciens]
MKIYITGLGVVSGIGIGVSENIEALRQGKHGIGKVTLFPTALDVPVSEVKHSNEELKQLLGISPQRTVSRTALLGMVAAKEALEDAGLNQRTSQHMQQPSQQDSQQTQQDSQPLRIGFISATSVGGMDLSEHFYESFKENPERGRLREVISHDCGASTELIASYLGINDFITTISTACSSAANAIMLGARMIKHGLLDAIVVGGTDALCRFTLNGFNSLMILDKAHCRPFDRSRTGLNLGEGAGYLVLQPESSLRRTPYCELSGYANTNEAYHQTGSSPEGDGAFLSMSEAIASSGISPEEIDYINVHGTGTPGNDASEGMALRRIFGEHVPPFSSVKAFIGHTLGASEGIEAVYSVLSLYKGMTYPNLNFTDAMPETGLIPETTFREGIPVHHVLSNSFGFGGNDSSLLFSATTIPQGTNL